VGLGPDLLHTHVSLRAMHATRVFVDSQADVYTGGAPGLRSHFAIVPWSHSHVLLRAAHAGWVALEMQCGTNESAAPGRRRQCDGGVAKARFVYCAALPLDDSSAARAACASSIAAILRACRGRRRPPRRNKVAL
jgi:hypothetical protein